VATIIRGQEGTTPRAWNAGDIFANLITKGTLEAFVQAGTGPADTSIVYVGTDTSTTPGRIIAVTNPVPANYAIGMLFNIKVNNTNDGRVNILTGVAGSVTLELNGKPYVIAKLSDGHDFIGAELTDKHEYIFVYDGITFSTQLVNAPRNPPQTVFYVRADAFSTVDMVTGLESATGFANTQAAAFKTIQGAGNTIKHRYISQEAITLIVADGLYTTGFGESTQFISSWNIIGNNANPQNCIIDARSTNSATYVPGGPGGSCIGCGNNAFINVEGFTFLSYYSNAGATGGGGLTLRNIHFNGMTSGLDLGMIATGEAGTCFIWGDNCSVGGTGALAFTGNGQIGFGWPGDVFGGAQHCTLQINGNPNPGYAWCVAYWNGVIEFNDCTFTGGVIQGPPYAVGFGGGFATAVGQPIPPATDDGIVDTSTMGWVNLG